MAADSNRQLVVVGDVVASILCFGSDRVNNPCRARDACPRYLVLVLLVAELHSDVMRARESLGDRHWFCFDSSRVRGFDEANLEFATGVVGVNHQPSAGWNAAEAL